MAIVSIEHDFQHISVLGLERRVQSGNVARSWVIGDIDIISYLEEKEPLVQIDEFCKRNQVGEALRPPDPLLRV